MSALAAPVCAFAPPPSVLPCHSCGGCPLPRLTWPRLTTDTATPGQNNRNKRKRPKNYAVSMKSSMAARISSTKSKTWQSVPYRSSRTLAERRSLTGPPLALPGSYAGQGGGEVFSGAVDADAEADALHQQQRQTREDAVILHDPYEELPIEGDRPRRSCVVYDTLEAPTPYNEGWEWQKQVSRVFCDLIIV